jgi:hypothetical protein
MIAGTAWAVMDHRQHNKERAMGKHSTDVSAPEAWAAYKADAEESDTAEHNDERTEVTFTKRGDDK